FLTHTGRYADATRPAENHYFQVGMTVHKNVVADETVHIAVVMNLAEWYETPNTIHLIDHSVQPNDPNYTIMTIYDRQVELEENGMTGVLFEGIPEGGHDD
ncbi:MAG: hypothetical protein KC729_19685, partial [Candidatus Eisenbacteria bacterium]|nr:hypothetical protein [Candidatus Eisenbacteria bacterium]